jgi:hypothetical protein
MTVAIARVTGADHIAGNKRVKVRTLTFSSTYATGGESVTAANVGLKKIDEVIPHGMAMSTDLATGNMVGYDYANSKFVFFESGSSGTAMAEKTNSEAYPTGSNLRCTFKGW